MRGIIYTRVSGDEQVKGTSLEFQEQLCRQYCTQRGLEVVELFREEGETAKDLSLRNRKKFLEALEYCRKRQHAVDAFVVLRVDRFARNTEDHFAVRKILRDYGVTLHSVTEPIGNSPAEKFIEVVLAGAAEYDNAIRRQRCTEGMAQKLKHGIWPWSPPLGYRCAHAKKRGEKKTEPDPPDEQVFELIQRGLKTYARGLCSQSELARMLDSWGLSRLLGKRTYPQLVDRMVGRYLRFYAGLLVNPWTGEETEGVHKPMITKGEMHQIILVRSGRAHLTSTRDRFNPAFPLRRTILCGQCKRPLTASSPRGTGGRYFYYHCHNRDCPIFGRSVPREELHAEFRRHIEQIVPKDEMVSAFKEMVGAYWKERTDHAKQAAQRTTRLLQALKAKRKRIYEMREDGSYSKEEFLERRAEVEQEIATATSPSEPHIGSSASQAALDYALNFIRDLADGWFSLPPQVRPKFQKLLFPEGIPYLRNSGFGTTKLGLIFKLLRDLGGTNSQGVPSVGLEPCDCYTFIYIYGSVVLVARLADDGKLNSLVFIEFAHYRRGHEANRGRLTRTDRGVATHVRRGYFPGRSKILRVTAARALCGRAAQQVTAAAA